MISAIFYLLGATALLIPADTSLEADLQGRCIHPAQPFHCFTISLQFA